jgi:hypothetical protein
MSTSERSARRAVGMLLGMVLVAALSSAEGCADETQCIRHTDCAGGACVAGRCVRPVADAAVDGGADAAVDSATGAVDAAGDADAATSDAADGVDAQADAPRSADASEADASAADASVD